MEEIGLDLMRNLTGCGLWGEVRSVFPSLPVIRVGFVIVGVSVEAGIRGDGPGSEVCSLGLVVIGMMSSPSGGGVGLGMNSSSGISNSGISK